MTRTDLIQRLRTGQRLFGTLITTNAPHWPEAASCCSLDFVFIDSEHVALDRSTIAHMCARYSSLDVAPLSGYPTRIRRQPG